MLLAVLVVLAAYLIGAIPFPVIVSRLVRGVDLREHGSGNMGARNAARVLGKRWFPVVFGLDFAKGAAATYLARVALPTLIGIDPVLAGAVGGLFAVLGHCFPVFAGFRGGVGLAASVGALTVVSPYLLLTSGAGILLGWAVFRDMYVGVAATALAYPAMGWYWLKSPAVVAVLAVWGLVVLYLHRADVAHWLAARKAS